MNSSAPEGAQPALFDLTTPHECPAPTPDRTAHVVGLVRDLAAMLPATELRPRLLADPALSPAERTAALAALDHVTDENPAPAPPAHNLSPSLHNHRHPN